MQEKPHLRRSVLYVPASNEKAMRKCASLACDAVIFDLEDAVAPEEKPAARERLRAFLASEERPRMEVAVRINALSSEWGTEDLLAARAMRPDAILLPKVDGPKDVLEADAALDETDAPRSLALWAMIETPRSILNLGAIAELGRDPAARLSCLVAGTNDLAKDTGIALTPDRRYLAPFLLQMVMAARAGDLCAIDGVSNDFRDLEAFERSCAEARAMGFDGKTLIHPAQIGPANAVFAPSAEALAQAEAVVEAFDRPENRGRGVISLDGRMVERLHLEMARRIIARAHTIREKDQ
ncbi:HpcH/HpaI aldolase [Nitratireductor indicus C115]|uniref:HpcH/HpaI aldolase n=1 Tax=Nitratireductor indicus C115 TaxID=1231190 RepID=K2N2X3_9HYPH|nr:CoA ester lyase [Nitratireductor indicus]EKF41768.1 HpcH/HpaI aldolase [Nitratireductor indicus C115]SFQ67515.1 citrate lyase subunit beta / citryl-CoA lyase [Nitratireductor indicus]